MMNYWGKKKLSVFQCLERKDFSGGVTIAFKLSTFYFIAILVDMATRHGLKYTLFLALKYVWHANEFADPHFNCVELLYRKRKTFREFLL